MPGAIATSFARNFDPAVLELMVSSHGRRTDRAEFTPGERLPDEVLAGAQQAMADHLCTPEDVAEAVLWAVTRPPGVHLAALVVRPKKDLACRRSSTSRRNRGLSGGSSCTSRPEARDPCQQGLQVVALGQLDPDDGGAELAVVLLHVLEQHDVVAGPEALVEELAQRAGALGEVHDEVVLEPLVHQAALDDLVVAGDVVVAPAQDAHHACGPRCRAAMASRAAVASAPAGSATMPSTW